MTRTDRIIELATALVAARAEVARLEAELEELAGGGPTSRIRSRGTTTQPGRRLRKEATPSESSRSPGEPPIPPANGTKRDQIAALAKEGRKPGEIATELGVPRHRVDSALYQLRKAGRLPKAGASR